MRYLSQILLPTSRKNTNTKIISMKKVYTTLGMTLVGMAAFANLTLTPKNTGELNLSQKAATAEVVNKTVNAGTRAGQITVSDILGEYIYDENRATQSNDGWQYGWCYPTIVAGTGNEVVINNFWNAPSTDASQVVCSVPATFDPAAMTLSIAPGVSLGKITDSQGTSYDLYMYIQDWDTSKCLNKNIVFDYNPETHAFAWYADVDNTYYYTENIVVCSDPNAIGKVIDSAFDFVVGIEMSQYNGIAASMVLDDSGNAQQSTYPVYATKLSDNQISIANMLSLGFSPAVVFDVNKSDMTVSAPKTLYAANYDFGQFKADLYFTGANGSNITGSIATTTDNNQTKTSINLGKLDILAEGVGAIIESTATQVVLPFDLLNYVGVKDITIDENAPVEYYNMQGMRVANPKAGQIVIARQGNKAVKMVVK